MTDKQTSFAHFQVEVDDVVLVDVVHCLANLPHKYRAGLFGEEEFVVEHSVEQFTAVDPVKWIHSVMFGASRCCGGICC